MVELHENSDLPLLRGLFVFMLVEAASMPRHIEAQAALNAQRNAPAPTQNLTIPVIHKNSLWRQRNALSCHNKHSLPLSYTANSEAKPSPHKINNNTQRQTTNCKIQRSNVQPGLPHNTFSSCLDLIRTSQSVCSFVRNGIIDTDPRKQNEPGPAALRKIHPTLHSFPHLFLAKSCTSY